MRYVLLCVLVLCFCGCESPSAGWAFEPCTQYGDSYLTAMSQYVCMLQTWDSNSQGLPPAPHSPSEMYAGQFPQPNYRPQLRPTVAGSYMRGLSSGYAGGAQAGALYLQAARNQSYGIALRKYYQIVQLQ